MACIRGADRCRHYMVEMQSNGKYVILGEDRAHSSLPDLVQYHTQVGIKPFMELLMLPCGQVSVLHIFACRDACIYLRKNTSCSYIKYIHIQYKI